MSGDDPRVTGPTVGSFLIRVETADDGHRDGTVTSVQTGEHASFDGFAELASILERWVRPDGASGTEED